MSDDVFLPLEPGEVVLHRSDEFYFRQCPGHLVDAEPSALMFSESTADAGKLSGARSSVTTAQGAYEHRMAAHSGDGLAPTLGTYGLTIRNITEVSSQTQAPLRAVDDSVACGPDSPPGHTYLDQRHLGDRRVNPDKRRVRAALYLAAMRHGRLWPEG